MDNTKLLPRHLTLLFFPIAVAILGGILFSGSFGDFTNNWSGRGISQAELYLAVSFFIGALALAKLCFPKLLIWGLLVFLPLFYGVLMIVRLGSQINFILLFLLNLICGFLLWLILNFTYFSKLMIRVRTLLFSLVSALVLGEYLNLLMVLLKQPNALNTFLDFFLNSLVLFIFIGVGISLANLIIVRKNVQEIRKETKEDDTEDDF